jgi:hypothetical protein
MLEVARLDGDGDSSLSSRTSSSANLFGCAQMQQGSWKSERAARMNDKGLLSKTLAHIISQH